MPHSTMLAEPEPAMTVPPGQPRARSDVSFHTVGDDALLFDPITETLYALGHDEAIVWCLFREYGDLEAVLAALAESSGRCQFETQTWLSGAVAQWSAAGLCDNVPSAATPVTTQPADRYRLLDVTIEVSCERPEDTVASRVLLAGFVTDAPPAVAVSLVHDRHGCAVVVEGEVFERAQRARQAIPMLKVALVRLSIARAHGLAALHAASLACHGRAVLLPAAAGAGKSTLAASAALSGWEMLGDDTVVLDASGAVRPLPFAICLKSGSWPVIGARFPALLEQPIYERQDGLLARYLLAPQPGVVPRPLAAVVLPRWRAGASPAISALTPGAAFAGLMPHLFPLAGQIQPKLIEHIARLLEHARCFAITYDVAADGIAMLSEALAP